MINREFVLAGKAIFSVKNDKGQHYTFKIIHQKGNDQFPPVWFIFLLTGPDNTSDYTYMGKIDAETGKVILTAKSKYSADSLPVKVADFGLRIIYGKQALPAGYGINHEGYCGRCARLLTVPESVESGIGPECAKKMMKCVTV